MKRIILFLVFFVVITNTFAQTNFMYSATGEKIFFKTRLDKLFLEAKSSKDANNLRQQTFFKSISEIKTNQFAVTIDTVMIKVSDLKREPGISNAMCMLEYSDGTLQVPSDKIFVKFKNKQEVKHVIDKLGLLEVIKSIELINSFEQIYVVTLKLFSVEDGLKIANLFYETGMCEFAEPSFVRMFKPHNTHYSKQWGLQNTGQNGGTRGVDVNITPVWPITRGNSNISIAVIDEGIDLTHSDLMANLLPGFDATVGAPGGTNGAPAGNDSHGTYCAGIISAINNNIGIVGVAPNCRIIPIRIAFQDASNTWVTNDDWIVNGIHHAWFNARADVLSNSWGGGSPSATISAEIQNAAIQGRNGLGCVVVFSTGNNYSSSVSYQASLNNVIAVGAIDNKGKRASFSNYGTNLDVVAPGVDIYTTAINDTYASKDGTSLAAPHVSGIAALILSVRPDLHQSLVRHAIESTCTKLPQYGFIPLLVSRPSGSWNNEVGYGLVNAYAAVSSVMPYISGPTLICPNNFSTYTLKNIPSNITDGQVTWSCSSKLQPQGGNNGRSKTFLATGGDESGWIIATVDNGTIVEIDVCVGAPPVITLSSGSLSPCPGAMVTCRPEFPENVGDILGFECQASNCTLLASGANIIKFQAPYGTRESFTLKIRYKNECGWSSWSNLRGTTRNCAGGEDPFKIEDPSIALAYPNPTSNILNVEVGQVTQAASMATQQQLPTSKVISATPVVTSYDIRLYDGQGNLLRRTTSRGEKVEFNVANLPNGLYYLHIYDGVSEQPEMRQIVVQH